jgi:P4 family phage/plasmid primase-like protien
MNAYLASRQTKDKSECTHTRIGNPEHNVYGGCYHIPDLSTFYPVYVNHVFTEGHDEHLTEKQLECGPLGIDLDFRYDEAKRMYTHDHILDFIDILLEELHKLFNIHENFPIYVFEKDRINVLPTMIKDGIHFIVGINLDHTSKAMLRNRILKKMTIWKDLHLINDWDSVIDENVFKGLTAWQLYGSKKPGHEAYKLTTTYTCEHVQESYEIHSSGDRFPVEKEFYKLSIRNIQNETPTLKDEYKQEYEQSKTRKRLRVVNDAPLGECSTPNAVTKELERLFNSLNVSEYMIQEAHLYAMCLPEKYYNDYDKWIRVGWALKNTDVRLFPSWIKFSSQSSKFNYADIPSLKQKWDSWSYTNEMLTLRSIMFWARVENPEEYDKIKEKSVDMALEEAIRDTCTEFDIATILYHLYKDSYVCVDIKSTRWFQYNNQKWEETDSGTELRKQITSIKGLFGIFAKKLYQVGQLVQALSATPEDERYKPLEKKKNKIHGIMVNMLKKNASKIMIDCSHIFYVKDFLELLDSKNHLMCFTNGVVDFSTNTFRNGIPEDYLYKCTKIPYLPFEEANPVIVQEVTTFMEQLFPDEELRNYMWDHAASVLIGKNSNQTFNIYIGGGRNGKSKFVELMTSILGDYKATVPLTLITCKRTSVGSVSPEVANLKGIRYAVMQESSVHDKINEGPMKELTGGDAIQCRALYKAPITFIPQFKLVMATNNLPDMDGKDEGTWRRIRACEFKSYFTETPTASKYQYQVDKNLDEKFDSWKPVFMSMLVKRAFITKGNVTDCKMVMVSSEKYRKDQDYLSCFIKDCIVLNASSFILSRDVVSRFEEWWKLLYGKNNLPKGKELMDYMNRVYSNSPSVTKKGTVWFGLQFVQEDEPVDLI